MLSIEAAKPFTSMAFATNKTRLLGVVDVVRTLAAQRNPELCRIVDNIKKLKLMLGIASMVDRRAA